MRGSSKWLRVVVCMGLLLGWWISPAGAREEYADRFELSCITCHEDSMGGALNTVGFAFIRNGYQYPIPERILNKAAYLRGPLHRVLRLIMGYLHLLTAVLFAGTILYLHLFVGPAQLTTGIPKQERLLGLSCMGVLIVTGSYLTWIRIDHLHQLFTNRFGIFLFIKLVLFATLLLLGLIAVLVLHRKMRRDSAQAEQPDPSRITQETLGAYDGSGDRPAYIAVEGKIYDVTRSPKWKDGRHFGKHAAGSDLTAALEHAPHSNAVLERVPQVGELPKGEAPPKTLSPAQKVFVVFTYVNLVLVLLILACVAMWRFGFPFGAAP